MQQTIYDNKINKSIRNPVKHLWWSFFSNTAVLAKNLQLDYFLNSSLSVVRSQESGAFCLL